MPLPEFTIYKNHFKNLKYKRVTDAITGETVNSNQLKLATKGGLWIRAEK